MTREEAIGILNETQVVYFAPNGKKKVQEALDMAIEALSADAVPFEVQLQSTREVIDRFAEDRVKVVRCKDCRYLDREDNYCTDGGGLVIGVTENDYCSRAVRREP